MQRCMFFERQLFINNNKIINREKNIMKRKIPCLTLLGLLLNMTACTPNQTTSHMPLQQTVWQIASLDGDSLALSQQSQPYITFVDGQTAQGFTGCNQFSGSYQTNANNMTFSNFYSTKKACFTVKNLESRLFYLLKNTQYYQIMNNQLLLLNKSKQPLATFKSTGTL